MYWKCPECPKKLSITDWTYSDLADRGTPICMQCDTDMELITAKAELTPFYVECPVTGNAMVVLANTASEAQAYATETPRVRRATEIEIDHYLSMGGNKELVKV